MIHIKDHKQQHIFDPWHFLSPKRRRMLDEDWPGLFRKHLLHDLPVEKIASYFKKGVGRPTKELHTVLGVLLLQQAMDLNDQAAIEQLCFNIQWHYALNIPEESDDAKYISEKTLYTMRQLMIVHNLDTLMFANISDKLAKVFDVDTKKQRIDSVHIHSNMRKLGRISIFAHTISKFLVNLKRHHCRLFKIIDQKVIDPYWGKKAMSVFSQVKPSRAAKTLQQVSADLLTLIEQFKDHPSVGCMHSYKLMQRVLAEQCTLESSDDGDSKVLVKKPADIASNSLQNPSDPDASYSGHKGQGYQVQVMETYNQHEDPDEKQKALNLITHVALQKACESDANALVPAITDTQGRQLAPDELLADTLYGSDDNHKQAATADISLIAPVHSGNATNTNHLTGFAFNDEGYVVACPAGHKPQRVRYKKKTDRFSAAFSQNHCQGCPRSGQCKLRAGKNKFLLHYSHKQYRLAARRAYEQGEAFAESYRWRAGVEATMSEFNRRTGVKKLRVRGMTAVRFAVIMKATGLNILRAGAVRKARRKARRANLGGNIQLYIAIKTVKEQILKIIGNFRSIFLENYHFAEIGLLNAA
ncbi:MAG: hypothetical protein HKO68_19435 [Desulfobacterales bacterium]|nr:hypothetical protein [Desulfobacterales bacterium]